MLFAAEAAPVVVEPWMQIAGAITALAFAILTACNVVVQLMAKIDQAAILKQQKADAAAREIHDAAVLAQQKSDAAARAKVAKDLKEVNYAASLAAAYQAEEVKQVRETLVKTTERVDAAAKENRESLAENTSLTRETKTLVNDRHGKALAMASYLAERLAAKPDASADDHALARKAKDLLEEHMVQQERADQDKAAGGSA
jgi:hypothetical protein